MIEANGQTSKQYPDAEQLLYIKGALVGGDTMVLDGFNVHDGANQKGVNCVGNWASLAIRNGTIARIRRDFAKLRALELSRTADMRKLLGGFASTAPGEFGGWMYGSLHVDYLKVTGLLPVAETPAAGTEIILQNITIDAPPVPADFDGDNALLGLIKDLSVKSLLVDNVKIPEQAGSTYQVFNNVGRYIRSVTFQNGCTGAWSFQNGGGIDCDIIVNKCPALSVALWTPSPGGHAWGGRIVVDGVPIAGNLIASHAPDGTVIAGPASPPASTLPPLPNNIVWMGVMQADGTMTSRRNGNTGVTVTGIFDKPLKF